MSTYNEVVAENQKLRNKIYDLSVAGQELTDEERKEYKLADVTHGPELEAATAKCKAHEARIAELEEQVMQLQSAKASLEVQITAGQEVVKALEAEIATLKQELTDTKAQLTG